MMGLGGGAAFLHAVRRFCLMFFASAAIGVAFGLLSALVSFFNILSLGPVLWPSGWGRLMRSEFKDIP